MAIPGIVLAYSSGARAQSCEPAAAKVISVQGNVDVSDSDRAHWRDVQLNQVLCAGQQVRLMAKSRAVLLLPNETLIHLDEGSVVTLRAIEPDKPAWLEFLRGALHVISRVPRALNIRTPFVNAGIEGTEFALRVDPARAELWVYEGRVRFSNRLGQLLIASGEAAAAAPGRAPEHRIVIKPRRAVEWALYYPPLLDSRPEAYPAALRPAMLAYRQNDFPAAFAALDGVPEGARDARYHTLRAGLLLLVGRVPEAEIDLTSAQRLDPKNGTAYALRSVIAVVRNEQEEALKLAAEAVRLSPGSATPYIARSYAEQAAFEIEKAHQSLQQASRLAPEDALVWARLSDIKLSLGDLDAALEAARNAEQLDPRLSRTQSVLGFAYLTRIEVDRAKTAFERAMALDPADPLPRLGLGLAKIRDGDLDEGTREIEIAASLDPNNSLVRSYLGKAYFDQKRSGLAKTEFDQAKLLDPKDPTPWFYDAILKQTINRPVEALHDLQRSIELNNNRAVYRSKLLLDQDLAARSAALGQIYNDLGFQQLGLVEGWKSVNTDPSNYSAHRLLADNYAALPRHEIARVSELLQSQLLQPINITPVQPQLAESDLFLLGGFGPAQSSFNEFNSLFLRDRFSLLASGLVGSNETYGDEVVHSGLWKNLSYSLGQFHYETEGFRPNSDVDTDIYNVFTQLEFSPRSNVQLEARHQATETGDLRQLFDPEFRFESLRQSFERDTVRLGLGIGLASNATLLASLSYREITRTATLPSFESFSDRFSADPALSPLLFAVPLLPSGFNREAFADNEVKNSSIELQYIQRWNRWNVIVGGDYAHQERTKTTGTTTSLTSPLSADLPEQLQRQVMDPELASAILDFLNSFIADETIPRSDKDQPDEAYGNAYTYANLEIFDDLSLTIGVAFHSIDRDSPQSSSLDFSHQYVLPKIGSVWRPSTGTTVRAAWFENVKRPFASGQTIEPTHVAGFNQLYDDADATRSERYGFTLDQAFPMRIKAGGEISWRDVDIPRFITGVDEGVHRIEQNEEAHRAYIYWTPTDHFAFAAEYFFESFDRGPRIDVDSGVPLELTTHRAPFSLSYYSPGGLFANLTATYVNQDVVVRGSERTDSPQSDNFWLLDASLGYRLPKRWGIVSFGVRNLLDNEFSYQDTNFDPVGELEGEPFLPPTFVAERVFFGQVTLAF
ncbi:MAG: TonB-dependent receptor domain-containing protein [Chromatiales bacterium]